MAINFFTPISYQEYKEKSIRQSLIEKTDAYFHWGKTRARVIPAFDSNEGQGVVLDECSPTRSATVLKIASMSFFFIIPSVLLVSKVAIRSSHNYYVIPGSSFIPTHLARTYTEQAILRTLKQLPERLLDRVVVTHVVHLYEGLGPTDVHLMEAEVATLLQYECIQKIICTNIALAGVSQGKNRHLMLQLLRSLSSSECMQCVMSTESLKNWHALIDSDEWATSSHALLKDLSSVEERIAYLRGLLRIPQILRAKAIQSLSGILRRITNGEKRGALLEVMSRVPHHQWDLTLLHCMQIICQLQIQYKELYPTLSNQLINHIHLLFGSFGTSKYSYENVIEGIYQVFPPTLEAYKAPLKNDGADVNIPWLMKDIGRTLDILYQTTSGIIQIDLWDLNNPSHESFEPVLSKISHIFDRAVAFIACDKLKKHFTKEMMQASGMIFDLISSGSDLAYTLLIISEIPIWELEETLKNFNSAMIDWVDNDKNMFFPSSNANKNALVSFRLFLGLRLFVLLQKQERDYTYAKEILYLLQSVSEYIQGNNIYNICSFIRRSLSLEEIFHFIRQVNENRLNLFNLKALKTLLIIPEVKRFDAICRMIPYIDHMNNQQQLCCAHILVIFQNEEISPAFDTLVKWICSLKLKAETKELTHALRRFELDHLSYALKMVLSLQDPQDSFQDQLDALKFVYCFATDQYSFTQIKDCFRIFKNFPKTAKTTLFEIFDFLPERERVSFMLMILEFDRLTPAKADLPEVYWAVAITAEAQRHAVVRYLVNYAGVMDANILRNVWDKLPPAINASYRFLATHLQESLEDQSKATLIAQIIIRYRHALVLTEIDPLLQMALYIDDIVTNINIGILNPFDFFQYLKKIVMEEVLTSDILEPLQTELIDENEIGFNLQSWRQRPIEALTKEALPPNLPPKIFFELFKALEERIEGLPENEKNKVSLEIKNRFSHSLDEVASQLFLLPYLTSLSELPKTEEIDQAIYQFQWILYDIQNSSNVLGDEDLFSCREEKLLSFCRSLFTCSTGQKEVIGFIFNKFYPVTPPELTKSPNKLQTFIHHVIDRLFHNTLSSKDFVSLVVTQKGLEEYSHQTLFLKNRFFRQIGLTHALHFDLYAHCIDDNLFEFDPQEFIRIFFGYLTPTKIIAAVRTAVDENFTRGYPGLSFNAYFEPLQAYARKNGVDVHSYFTMDVDCLNITGLNTRGIIALLAALNLFKI